MALELVTPLPPGAPSHTRLARHGARLVVLREIKDGTDCSWPQPSPNMVTLQEVGELQGKRHALFPWVPGVTLRELVKALEAVGKPVPVGLAGRVLIDAARALASITPARAHGGIQDGALQIGFDGKVSVLDFGAPRVSRFRPLGRVNFSADVFALGGVLHAVLTGFEGEYATPPASLATPSTSHAEATPAIDDVVMRALSPQPDSRQSDAASFADELEAVLGPELFSAQGLSEMVSALFKDRIKLLHSLGGLVEEQPSLEAELPPSGPMAGIPMGTQPAWGVRLQPPSEPTLPRVVTADVQRSPSLGDDPLERTETKIPAPARSMVPWDSNQGLTAASSVPDGPLTRPSSGPPLSGARPDADTNPRAAAARREADLDTNPRASAPPPRRLPADTDQASGAPVRASAPRPLGAEGEHAPTLAGGPRALSRNEMEAARPRPSASRPVFDDHSGKTAAIDLPDDTNPRALPPEDTAPRARPPARRAEEELEDTGPSPRPRNTTEAERYRAKGQERLPTPPQGLPAATGEEEEEEDEDGLLNEPTAVRSRPDPRMTAQTAQTLLPAPAPASSGAGLRVLMVVLLLVVVGLAGAIVLKLKRESEQPLPLDESVLEVVDAGEAPVADAGLAAALPELDLDGGDGEEEEEDGGEADSDAGTLDGGAADAGLADGGVADAGAPDAGPKVVKKVVKKVKKKKRRRRR